MIALVENTLESLRPEKPQGQTGRQVQPASLGMSHSPVLISPRVPLSSDNGIKSTSQQQFKRLTLEALKETVVAKLYEAGLTEKAAKIDACGTETKYAVCRGCERVTVFTNHCDNFVCPCCQPKLARKRAEGIEWWASQIKQPKHVVLTCRNADQITKTWVRSFQAAVAKLRRRKLAKNWAGGCWSLEVTNEGRGWHLHAHLLVDARFIDVRELSTTWGKLVGQEFAIVYVKDCRRSDYLREVTKYAVKGSELASWSSEDLAAFVTALDGVRTFGTFGTLFKLNAEWKEYVLAAREAALTCPCGCQERRIFSHSEYLEWETLHAHGPPVAHPAPEPYQPDPQLSLAGVANFEPRTHFVPA